MTARAPSPRGFFFQALILPTALVLMIVGWLVQSTSALLASQVLVYVGALALLYFHVPSLFLLMLPYNLPQLTATISVAYLETGAFPSEIATITYFTGATYRLVLLNLVFMIGGVCFFVLSRHSRGNLNNPAHLTAFPIHLKVLWYGIMVVVIIYCASALFTGFPLFSGSQRFFFWRDHPFGWVMSKVLSSLPYLGVFFGYYLSATNSSLPAVRRISLRSIVVISVIAVLYGNKFGWFMDLSIFLGIGYTIGKGLSHPVQKLFSLRFALILSIAIAGMLAIIVNSYVNSHGYELHEVAPLILSRVLELQGQVWWATDKIVTESDLRGALSALYSAKTADNPAGIFILMELIAPNMTFWAYFDDGVPFSMGYPAITHYIFGFTGALLVQIFLGFIWTDLLICLAWYVRKGDLFKSSLLILLLVLFSWSFSLGSTYVLFGPLGLSLLAFYLVSTIWRHFAYAIKCNPRAIAEA